MKFSQNNDEKKSFVKNKFSSVTSRYDLLNTLLSFSVDKYWRKRTAETLKNLPDGPILDLCAGTLPLSIVLRKYTKRKIIALDFCLDMLLHGKNRINSLTMANDILLVQGDAELIPFKENVFSGITIAFGIRNLANPEKGLMEMFRVLKPGGVSSILEFSRPKNKLFSKYYFFYLHNILPNIGGIISGDQEAYSYLATSIQEFHAPEVVAAMMESAGFKDVKYRPLTFGIVTLYTGRRPSTSSVSSPF